MPDNTTVAVTRETLKRLHARKGGPGTSYDDVITDMLEATAHREADPDAPEVHGPA
jgi:hypothetical protein